MIISRSLYAAVIATATAGAALADVQVNTPGAKVDAPSGPANVQVQTPGAKPDAPSAPAPAAQAPSPPSKPDIAIKVEPKMAPNEAWVGRALYSSDGKNLGEIAAISGDQIYADVGGFLGIGTTRILLTPDQITSVQPDRIELKLTKAEADQLPSADEKPAVTK